MLLTAPTLGIMADGPNTITGYVTTETTPDPEATIFMQVEVDIDDDGTIDAVLDTFYDDLMDRYLWSYQVSGGSSSSEDTDYAFRPVEWVGSSKSTGDKVVVTISEPTNEAPVLQNVWANEFAVWGVVTDDNMTTSGVYSVEVSESDPAEDYLPWGSVDQDGTFYLNNLAGNSSGTTVLWVRVRETSSPSSAVSNAIRVEFSSSTGSGSSGGDSSGGGESLPMGGSGLLANSTEPGNEQSTTELLGEPDESETLLSYWLHSVEERELISLF